MAIYNFWNRNPTAVSIRSNLGKENDMNKVQQILKAKGNQVWTISKGSAVFDV